MQRLLSVLLSGIFQMRPRKGFAEVSRSRSRKE